MRQLTGAASALAAAVWDAHGAPAMARVSALRHLRCDASEKTFASTASSPASSSFASAAAAADTASALASLAHHAAVDIASDNRLLPQQSWTSSHRFDGTGCANPTTRAVLVHRAFPHAQAVEKAWTVTESVMVEVSL